MARIGLCKPYVADYSASQGSVTYSDIMNVGKAVEVEIDVDSNERVVFRADNTDAESVSVFSSGTLNLQIDRLAAAVAAKLYGLETESSTTPSGGTVIKYKTATVSPYLGFGIIVKSIESGAEAWMGLILRKVQFHQNGLTQATEAETIEFTAPEVTASILRDDQTSASAEWMRVGYFATEANAELWVKTQLGYVEPVVTT